MRRAFSDTLLRLGREDERVIFLTGDLGFQVFDQFVAEFPRRYVNVGVQEAQLVNCAAGLALEGWKPIVYSIASFMTGRAFEQIRIALGYHRLPVLVIGAGGGYTYANSGVTHHAKEDLALMSLIPGMTVTCPGGPDEISALVPALLQGDGPSYLRLGRFGEPPVPTNTPVVNGRARIVRAGQGVAFVTTGNAVIAAAAAADRLAESGMHAAVLHYHTLKPFDADALAVACEQAHTLIVVEEHGETGGLRSAVRTHLASGSHVPRVIGIGPSDDMVLGNPTLADMVAKFGLDEQSLTITARQAYEHRMGR